MKYVKYSADVHDCVWNAGKHQATTAVLQLGNAIMYGQKLLKTVAPHVGNLA